MVDVVQFEFVVLDWSAYAEGLDSPQAWLGWAGSGASWLPAQTLSAVPAMSEMPAMMRRRVDRLGRLACQVAYWCQAVPKAGPLVFASRYGDAQRSLALLGDLVRQEALSPTGFTLSVHNAVSALYAIARGDMHNAVVVAAGAATAMAALVEAAGLLADGAPEVLVVFYDAPLPAAYAHFQDEPGCEYAWALRLAGRGRQDGAPARLAVSDLTPTRELAGASLTPALPMGLQVFHHVLMQVAAWMPEDHRA